MSAWLQRVRIVLVETSHPGNIGSAARAMKTMGLARLVLVTPREFPHPEAVALAAGADDVLSAAVLAGSLAEAVADCQLVLGCTARSRTVSMTELSPQAAAERIGSIAVSADVALVFGNERVGLSNDELQQCHAAVHIATDPEFGSLNLAAAVQVLCYELRLAQLGADVVTEPASPRERTATASELEGMFEHLQRALADIDFFKGRAPFTIMRRLRRLFLRAQLSEREVMIVRGILSDAQRVAHLAGMGQGHNTRAEYTAKPKDS